VFRIVRMVPKATSILVATFLCVAIFQDKSWASSEVQIISQAPKKLASPDGETLRGIKSLTRRKIVLMPVTDKSGQGSTLSDFASEVLQQALLNGGITTVDWFKVNKALRKSGGYSNPYGSSSAGVSDETISEVITISKNLGARYVLRPVILGQSLNSEIST